MKNKHCEWCDNTFQAKLSYQIYCSASCREEATKDKIAKRYAQTRIQKRTGKLRLCKNCTNPLSIYNDDVLCTVCQINPDEVKKALRDIKGLANGKD